MDAHSWWHLFRLMQQNHVTALTAETIATLDVPREVMMPWLSEQQKAKDWYSYQLDVQEAIVELMDKSGIKTLVLKGTHTAQYYPQPELREFGDLDLYFYNKHDEADMLAEKRLRVTVSNEAHHHSKYNYRGVTVESHYDFLNTHYPPSNRSYEKMLKEQVGTATFEVLFLLRHMAGHFAASRITLRDLVDWALTCQALRDKADWALVDKSIEDFGMTDFVAVLNAIAEQRLGISMPRSLEVLKSRSLEVSLTRKMEKDIVYGSAVLRGDGQHDGLDRLGWKLRRWRALGWKREMVYNDSPLRLFLASLTSHAEKPQSILHKQ
jgi:hypothetical protein